MKNWISQIREETSQNVVIYLIGNKIDLEEKREVQKEEAENFAKSIGCKYYEGSAKTDININEPLDEIAKITYLSRKDKIKNKEINDSMMTLSKKNINNKEKKKCC